MKMRLYPRRLRDQTGQVLILTLVLLLIGSIIIPALLSNMSSGVRTNAVFEKKSNEYYAADAGIEDGRYHIKYDKLATVIPDYDPYDYVTDDFTYNLSEQANNEDVTVTIKNIWIPKDLAIPDKSVACDVIQGSGGNNPKIILTGSIASSNTYQIKIQYYPQTGETLKIKTLGIWLSAGFGYVSDGTNPLEGTPYNITPTISTHAGGKAVVWDFVSETDPEGYPFTYDETDGRYFPGNPNGDPMTSTIQFGFTGPMNEYPSVISWVDTNLDLGGLTYTWDADTKVFKVISEAGSVDVEAYFAKNELRQMGGTIAGDYRAIGNSLLKDVHTESQHIRESILESSEAEITDIPDDADVQAAYLYWSGWYRTGVFTASPPFPDYCVSYDNWIKSPDASRWTISSNEFQGQGISSATDYQRTLAMENSLDLSLYSPGEVSIIWKQREVGSLESTDALKFAISGDGGTTWSSFITAFSDDNPAATYTYTISDSAYLTSSFKMKFYFTFSDLAEYVYLDDIKVIKTYFSDTCISFDEWDKTTSSSGNQVRVPAVDGDINGTWNTSPLWDDIDETTPFDSDYITGVTVSGGYAYALFTGSAFSIPTGSVITNLMVYYRAKDVSNGGNNIRAALKVGGIVYSTTDNGKDPGNSFSTYSYVFNTNPKTGAAWTVDDINGSGSNPLQQFGISSTDLNPDVQVSMVYAQVNYENGSRWSIYSSDDFRGQGLPGAAVVDKIITLKNSLDLSASVTGTIDIEWEQSETGELEYGDTLYYAFSGDGGTIWSDNYEAFHDDSPDAAFSCAIPETYLTSDFKMRLYFNFNDASEYVFLDNINVVNTLFTDDCSSFTQWDWTPGGSQWTIDSERFMGQGNSSASEADKTITLKTDLDLSACPAGSGTIEWGQSEYGSLGTSDGLYFALSNDGGVTWSSNITAFVDDNPSSTFTYTLPDEYLTSTFRMRIYFSFTDETKFVYLDNIKIGSFLKSPDDSCIFKINDTQVYLDSSGNPQVGEDPIIADSSQIIDHSDYGFNGYSYACRTDVTELIRAFSTQGSAANYTGNGTYTIGGVDAAYGNESDSSYQLGYAGWSLIVVYSSSQTQGHQLYLFDTFSYCVDYVDLDFDHDSNEGGVIEGFLVPQPVTGETNAAKLTVFMGEGDEWITGDYLSFNGTKLWDGTTSNGNTQSSPNNVWNSKSVGSGASDVDGVDVDTFTVTWASGLLDPGDSSATVNMHTEQDNWNLVYIILAFRSETTTGGTLSYLIHQ